MRKRAYSSYRTSGTEWLGDIPTHWKAERLKTAALYWVSNVDKVPSDDEEPVRLCNYTDVYYHDRITPDMDLMESTATVEEIERFRLEADDVVITKDSEDWSDIAIPALIERTAPDFVCGYHLAIIRSDKQRLRGDFLLRVLQSNAINQQFQTASTGVTRYGLPKSSIGEASIPIPPLREQESIATFLDRQTSKIDRLISKKRLLIERLQERRAALVTRAVTRGLSPQYARRDGGRPRDASDPSGMDWLNCMPSHWQSMRFRRLIGRLDQGNSLVAATWPAEIGEWGALKLSAARLGRFFPMENKALEKEPEDSQKITPQAGDVLISRSNTLDRVGDVCLVETDEPMLVIPDLLYRVKVKPELVVPAYLCFFLLSAVARAQIEADARGSSGSMVKLGQDHVRDWWVPVPPREEQVVIVAYLNAEISKIERASEEVRRLIARLREYRAAQITAAVTGKIDVRKRLV